MDEIDVLVVDDAPDVAESLAMVLEMDGYATRVVFSAADALRVCSQTQPLCVMLDIHMPGMDGLDLTRQLRARFGDDVVLVAITGSDVSEQRVAEALALVDHHFTKPVSPELIRQLLPQRR